jgi:hypothetical protein
MNLAHRIRIISIVGEVKPLMSFYRASTVMKSWAIRNEGWKELKLLPLKE